MISNFKCFNNILQQPKGKRFCEERSVQPLCLHLCPVGNSLLLCIGILVSLFFFPIWPTESTESVRCDCTRVTFLWKHRNRSAQVLQRLCRCDNPRIRWIPVPYQRTPSICALHIGNFLRYAWHSEDSQWAVCPPPFKGSRGITESLLFLQNKL